MRYNGVTDSTKPNGAATQEGDDLTDAPEHPACQGDWHDRLLRTPPNKQGKSKILGNLANVAITLEHARWFKSKRIRFDELAQNISCQNLPWDKSTTWRDWSDFDDAKLAQWFQMRKIDMPKSAVQDGVTAFAFDHRHNPVVAYLKSLRWDGRNRLDIWLTDYLGADVRPEQDGDTTRQAYVRQIGRKWPISAVARAFDPGCKVDHMLVLEGKQGEHRKSSTLAALMPERSWFADQISVLGSKDAGQDLRGKWLIEISELTSIKKSDVETVKAFLSRSVDHYRPSYGRRSIDHPRRCVFAGSTNSDAYLVDPTGNRRIWPVRVTQDGVDRIAAERDQLWAEAVHAYQSGEAWWLDAETEATARAEQADRHASDPWQREVLESAEWLHKQSKEISVCRIMDKIGLQIERRDRRAEMRIAAILRLNHWVRHRKRLDGGRGYAWAAPESS